MTIAVVGDSHAEGLSSVLPDELEAEGHSVVLFEHHRGWSTKRMVDDGVFERAHESGADIVIVSSGTNDALNTNLAPMFEAKAALRGQRVLWLLPGPSRVERVQRQINASRGRLLAINPLAYVDGASAVGLSDLAGDGIHYTREGYRKLARMLTQRAKHGLLASLILPILLVAAFGFLLYKAR